MKACIASGSYDLTVRIWDAVSSTQIITIQHPEAQINCLSFVPPSCKSMDVEHIAIGTWQKLKIFDISQNTQPVLCPSFEGASKNITTCGFSLPNMHGTWMFTGGDDGHVRIFDTKPITQRQHVSALTCHNALEIGSSITNVILHLNQIELFIADQAGRVHIWDLSKQSIDIPELATFEFIVKLAIHPVVDSHGTILSGITNRGNLITWRLTQTDYNETMMPLGTTTEAKFLDMVKFLDRNRKERIGLSLSYTRDGRFLIVTFSDAEIMWLHADDYPHYDKKEKTNFSVECDWNWDTLVTTDNKFMFTGGSDGKLKVWDVATQKLLRKMDGHHKGISALAISEL